MIRIWTSRPRSTNHEWSLMIVLYICSTLTSLIISSSAYTVITADEANDHTVPEVTRRGYAGVDFYAKASKSIPRMGRRSDLDPLEGGCRSCGTTSAVEESNELSDELDDFYGTASKSIPRMGRSNELSNNLVKNDSNVISKLRLKRFHSLPTEVSAWPWFRDHIPDISKRNEITENCYYMPNTKNYVSSNEICCNLICCSLPTDASILKRSISTYSSKQSTTNSPNYKSNRFM